MVLTLCKPAAIASCLVFLLPDGQAMGQILRDAETLKADAERAMIEFVSTRDEWSADVVAAIAKVAVWSAENNRITDIMMGQLEDGKEKYHYSIVGLQTGASPYMSVWSQRIWLDGRAYQRDGTGGSGDRFRVFDAPLGVATPEMRRVSSSKPSGNLFFVPIGSYGFVRLGLVGVNYGVEMFVIGSTILGAKTDDKGQLVGVWRFGTGTQGSIIEVTFSKSTPHLPVKTVMRRVDAEATFENYSKFGLFSVVQTAWKKFPIAGKDHHLPIYIVAIDYNYNSGVPTGETEFWVEWKTGINVNRTRLTKEQLTSETERVVDWRTALTTTFDSDWSFFHEKRTLNETPRPKPVE